MTDGDSGSAVRRWIFTGCAQVTPERADYA